MSYLKSEGNYEVQLLVQAAFKVASNRSLLHMEKAVGKAKETIRMALLSLPGDVELDLALECVRVDPEKREVKAKIGSVSENGCRLPAGI